MKKQNKSLTLTGHLVELRKRLAIAFIINLIAIFGCYEYSDKLVSLFLELNPGMNLVYLSPPELFLAYLKISLIGGLVLASPITISQIWAFIGPGLYREEKFSVLAAFCSGVVCFLSGSFFAYKVVLPTMLGFFSRIQMAEIAAMISVGSYLDFICSILLTFGLVFEIPVVAALLAKFGLLKASTLRKKQPVLILAIFVIAALITPPDVISQIMLAVPMILLLQLSIFICWSINKIQEEK